MRKVQDNGRGERRAIGPLKHKLWFWPVLVAGVVADQLTKILAFAWLQPRDYSSLIPCVVGLRRSENQGALFGIMQGKGALLALFSVAAFGLILWFLRQAPSKGKWLPVALGLIAAGAIGNLIDRVFNDGKVRDFIELHIGEYVHWPTFNLADAFIVAGVAMVIYAEFKKPKTTQAD